ncbi:MAG: alpha-E domain-containing protein [Hydrogenophilus sp.]|nr:alpha-E domain-containing protein [Hydrogenophilus sp.]
MLARVAEQLFWAARYLERCENTARLLLAVGDALRDAPPGATVDWGALVAVIGLEEVFAASHRERQEEAVVRFLVAETDNPSALVRAVAQARENARTVRDVLASEVWTRINRLYHLVREGAESAQRDAGARSQWLSEVIERLDAIQGGMANGTMHDAAYVFWRLGVVVERGDMTTRALDLNAAVEPQGDPLAVAALRSRLWVATLRALSALEAYRRHVGVEVDGKAVCAFLLGERRFPRAEAFLVEEALELVSSLPRSEPVVGTVQQWRRVVERIREGLPDSPAEMHTLLDRLQVRVAAVSDAIGTRFFGGGWG